MGTGQRGEGGARCQPALGGQAKGRRKGDRGGGRKRPSAWPCHLALLHPASALGPPGSVLAAARGSRAQALMTLQRSLSVLLMLPAWQGMEATSSR